ncbi:MAG: zf-HC2 domain-containing protein [Calditrichaeota bacterium]|nr:zf-HC2 domain-containing protein [Calditrichota bacterium]
MKCTAAKKKFIALIDGELTKNEKIAIQTHLEVCSKCQVDFEFLKKIYIPAHELKPIAPAPFLWQKIYLRLAERKQKKTWGFGISEFFPRIATAAAIFLLLVTGITFGVYLGNFSDSIVATDQNTTAPTEELVRDAYLDAFDTIPPESVAGVYFSLQTAEPDDGQQ